jgi:hypothetical protein
MRQTKEKKALQEVIQKAGEECQVRLESEMWKLLTCRPGW